MCDAALPRRRMEAVGEFMKGNEPAPVKMPIIAVQCGCGAWFAQFPGHTVWVPAEPVAA